MTDYLIGTGGWAYFNVPDKTPLKAYSEVFNFVEVNYTFYEYPEARMVRQWRRTVPRDFTFAVRCHQDLTHRIGLKSVDEAYSILTRMVNYCEILDSPFLILETPASYVFNNEDVQEARNFFSSSTLRDVRLVWEVRAPSSAPVLALMQDLNLIECIDLSIDTPSVESDIVYSRLFGMGKHNVYQFTDEELLNIDQKINRINPRIAALSYHGVRMNTDAARYMQYKKTGNFIPITDFTGADSAKVILSEDAQFPLSKTELIEHQGWKVIDLRSNERVHLSEFLSKIPNKIYNSADEVAKALEAIM